MVWRARWIIEYTLGAAVVLRAFLRPPDVIGARLDRTSVVTNTPVP
jgi:hypothetical protein